MPKSKLADQAERIRQAGMYEYIGKIVVCLAAILAPMILLGAISALVGGLLC